MQNISKIIFLVFFIRFPTFGEITQSFFMDDEDSEIALEMAKKSENTENIDNDNLELSGIFFIDETSWTVWINGIPYSSIGQHGDFSIDEVSEDSVSITNSEGEVIKLSVKC